MLYAIQKIESTIDLPYKLIDIDTGREHFIFQFRAFDDNQSDYSIKMGGVTGKFSVIYQGKGINCNFGCDITVGNVYEFYMSLNDSYNMLGQNSAAILKNYGSLNQTNLTINFDNKGHCFVDGYFKNEDNFYESGIIFSFRVDQTYLSESLNSMKTFFEELRRIQGHNTFY